MRVAIVSTGDELMQGIITNTNASWLAEQCHRIGHEVVWQVTVSDDEAPIGEAVKEATTKAECVIVSGGLGPTADDITVEAVAKVFNKKLVQDKAIVETMRAFFKRVARPMSDSNLKQALIPEGGKPLVNTVGTAPGVHITLGKAEVFFLPGVPQELYQIFHDSVLPWLQSRADVVCVEQVLHCFGIPEASIDEKLKGVDLCGTRLSFRVRFPEILLKVMAREATETKARAKTEKAAANIRQCLGRVVYGEGATALSQVVGELLRAKRATIATAESCTGGQIADLLTDISGASEYFERGIVTYSNRSKMELLGCTEATLQKYGAVSRECALEMARGVRERSGTTFGLAVTGIAGPTGGSKEKPVGTVHVALAWDGGEQANHFCFTRERKAFKTLVSWTALDMVRKHF